MKVILNLQVAITTTIGGCTDMFTLPDTVWKKIKTLVCLPCLFSVVIAATHHKIMYLIATPRSLSTAFIRAMHARGDMEIFNEPAQQAWMIENGNSLTQDWYIPDTPTTSSQVVDLLLDTAQTRSVFAKDQSFIVQNLLEHDHRLLHDPHVIFAFLLRNPHHAIISFYKKWGRVIENFSYLVGYQSLYTLFLHIKEQTDKIPVVVCTENLYTNPENTVRKFCAEVDIPFLPHALHWQSLDEQCDGITEWHETKNFELTHYWHGDAIFSTSFTQPTQYEVDADGKPTFLEITNPLDRQICQQAYEENLKYYHLFLNTLAETKL